MILQPSGPAAIRTKYRQTRTLTAGGYRETLTEEIVLCRGARVGDEMRRDAEKDDMGVDVLLVTEVHRKI